MTVVTTAEMRELDRRTIELGTPGLVLMERAGAGVVRSLTTRARGALRRGTLVLAGRGNNGGDGFVVARLLRAKGHRCTVALLAPRDAVEGDARVNLERWVRGRGRLLDFSDDPAGHERLQREIERAGVVVDAIFGTGLRAPTAGLARAAIEALGRVRAPDDARERTLRRQPVEARERAGRRPWVVAVDLPSGLHGDSGEPLGEAIRADLTVTFAAAKVGLVLPASRGYVGDLEVVDIGIAASAWEAISPGLEAMSEGFARDLLPRRRASAHKGSHGHVVVIGGSLGKSGAAILSARGAIRGGAGLATVACDGAILPIVAAALPEAMSEPLPAEAGAESWLRLVAGRSAAVIGPGLGQEPRVAACARAFVRAAPVPVVVDADALNALAADRERTWARDPSSARILTPHPGEMARLVGGSTEAVQAARLPAARDLARLTGAVVVLKGAGTIIAAPDGRAAVNTTGGPLLATGGSGDVLAGLVGALLAQGLAAFDAACLGVYLHGRAADDLATRLGDAGLMATELADEIPCARARLAGLLAPLVPPETLAISRRS